MTKSVKTLLFLFSSEARFKGVNLAPKGEVGADLLIQTNKYHKKSNRTLILIMQPLELR
ncbi:hypothetical protein Dia5BBH33_13230 [Dialister hominis]|uniref:Uncharacterized protein n=1 Tax=Dialister hominis TaxID=2582419 RepID=A0A8D5A1X6_9FIRM|nr:hypothetical protein Dia5BBH33_13230 [Dialister hominis]